MVGGENANRGKRRREMETRQDKFTVCPYGTANSVFYDGALLWLGEMDNRHELGLGLFSEEPKWRNSQICIDVLCFGSS